MTCWRTLYFYPKYFPKFGEIPSTISSPCLTCTPTTWAASRDSGGTAWAEEEWRAASGSGGEAADHLHRGRPSHRDCRRRHDPWVRMKKLCYPRLLKRWEVVPSGQNGGATKIAKNMLILTVWSIFCREIWIWPIWMGKVCLNCPDSNSPPKYAQIGQIQLTFSTSPSYPGGQQVMLSTL